MKKKASKRKPVSEPRTTPSRQIVKLWSYIKLNLMSLDSECVCSTLQDMVDASLGPVAKELAELKKADAALRTELRLLRKQLKTTQGMLEESDAELKRTTNTFGTVHDPDALALTESEVSVPGLGHQTQWEGGPRLAGIGPPNAEKEADAVST